MSSLAEGPATPGASSLLRPRVASADTDVPIVLRLPDVYAMPASAAPAPAVPAADPLPEGDARSAQALPLWLFVVAASLVVGAGLVVLDRWKAYRAASGPKLGPTAMHQPVPTWKVPSDETATRPDNAGMAAQARPGDSPKTSMTPADETVSNAAQQVEQAATISPAARTEQDAPGAGEFQRPLNPHFGPRPESFAPQSASPAEAVPVSGSQSRADNRPGEAGGDPSNTTGAVAGVAQLEGVIVKPSPRPSYDRARQGLY